MNTITEEQIWFEKQMAKMNNDEFFREFYNSEYDQNKEAYERRSRIISKDDLLKCFSENAESKLMRSGLFNNIFQSLMAGSSRYEIIETLVDMVEDYQKINKKLIENSTKPIYIRTEI